MTYPPLYPQNRLRRLRCSESWRDMFALPWPGPEKFIYPLFVVPGKGIKSEIESMPGQHRWSIDRLPEIVNSLAAQNINAVLLFGVPHANAKKPDAGEAVNPDGLVPQAIRVLRSNFPSLLIFTDVCICAYSANGHCEIDADFTTDTKTENCNDLTLKILTQMALIHAEAGADCIAPSAMMDGQVAAIRNTLDAAGYAYLPIMSYSTKMASSMYGPFREAAASAPETGDRRGYQADYRNPRIAWRESISDMAEGADIIMVKPALFYFDLIADLRRTTIMPIAAYNVSGEYSMIAAAAEKGIGDLYEMVRESIFGMARAGTDIFISYWALQYDKLTEKSKR